MTRATVYDPAGREQAVTLYARPWGPLEDGDEITGLTVLGPVTVRTEHGGLINALAGRDAAGSCWAVYWCRYLGAMRVLPIDDDVERAIERAVEPGPDPERWRQ